MSPRIFTKKEMSMPAKFEFYQESEYEPAARRKRTDLFFNLWLFSGYTHNLTEKGFVCLRPL